jgi:hypothetical protein
MNAKRKYSQDLLNDIDKIELVFENRRPNDQLENDDQIWLEATLKEKFLFGTVNR